MGFEFFQKRHSAPQFFFSEKEKEQIVAAIRNLEYKTSAEIRVHIERRKSEMDVMAQARDAFERIGMTATNKRNGVLIFISSDTPDFAILGDELINKELPENFWDEIVRGMQAHFRENRFADGIVEAIMKTGESLKEYFPYHSDDQNELPDDISVE